MLQSNLLIDVETTRWNATLRAMSLTLQSSKTIIQIWVTFIKHPIDRFESKVFYQNITIYAINSQSMRPTNAFYIESRDRA